jgi:hypothetical protein
MAVLRDVRKYTTLDETETEDEGIKMELNMYMMRPDDYREEYFRMQWTIMRLTNLTLHYKQKGYGNRERAIKVYWV